VKLLIDQQLPAALVGWFSQRGVEAVHVRSLGMASATDSEIWSYAFREGLVIVTKDEDFANRRRHADGPQILWLHVGNAPNRILERHLDITWSLAQGYLDAGEAIVEV